MSNRPKKLNDIIGQQAVVARLKISIEAALQQNQVFRHTVLDGPKGTGKTTLACVIANELDASIEICNGAAIKSVEQITPYIMRIEHGSILFVDEIHGLRSNIQEYLYPVMEDYRCDIGSESKVSIKIPKFTLIGATTNAGGLEPPLYDRFVNKLHLELYKISDLILIARRVATQNGFHLDDEAAELVACASKDTPRVCINLLAWIQDYVIVQGKKKITGEDVENALKMAGITSEGLSRNDIKYLQALAKFNGGPVGLNTLSAATGISCETLMDNVEPFLIRRGRIKRGSRGRELVRHVAKV